MRLFRMSFKAMAAVNEIQLYAEDEARAKAAAMATRDEVLRIEAKFSRYRPDSIVSRINAAAGEAPVPIDEETLGLLAFADACHENSGGLFDPTAGVLRAAWNFQVDHVPSDAELAPLLGLIGWKKVELTDTTVRLPEYGMELDFGGFGKEYAVDRAAVILKEKGFTSALVNLAGDLAILGTLDDGLPWRVGIKHPRVADAVIAQLPVSSGALATSGDYERFIEVDGVRHCHILDPRTGRSARGLRSVTVHAPTCLVAGSATTIAMLKGEREGLAWLKSLGLKHYCMLGNGEIVDRFK
ncbi:FAD:protein FMN transferase [Usitatibacter palustris]|uniref:FAD:protein FMN transferase n=1 Tax=Usitatibacter palustris TaxID=2732487 RepID=A0A6M4H9J8_9PROT|nr:FAD:protein FMN transferase [Usitatibacter palustris]QJR14717.1 FAD:protein FMN transferase [Usitatibacter palustris]